MRFQMHASPTYPRRLGRYIYRENDQERNGYRFFWFPYRINDIWYWLETALVEEYWSTNDDGQWGSWAIRKLWNSDEPEFKEFAKMLNDFDQLS